MALLQQAAKQRRQLPKDFVLVMDFDGTNIVEKANSDPLAKVTILQMLVQFLRP